ncbi:hypothetical protein MmmBen468_0582 [Mycoplasma mycoides subsp. mycoides]|nr:hypothetical protein MmmBen468_0582 [Mycoplasma mycoides subsp. mycoides]
MYYINLKLITHMMKSQKMFNIIYSSTIAGWVKKSIENMDF